MAVNPVSSGSNYVSQVQPQPQTYAERTAEKQQVESQNTAAAQQSATEAATRPTAPPPTVNTSGQEVGTIINVKA